MPKLSSRLQRLASSTRVLERLRQIGEQFAHLRRRLQVLLGRIQLRPLRIGQHATVVDADARLVRLEIFAFEEAHIVAGDDRHVEFDGQGRPPPARRPPRRRVGCAPVRDRSGRRSGAAIRARTRARLQSRPLTSIRPGSLSRPARTISPRLASISQALSIRAKSPCRPSAQARETRRERLR